MSRRTIEAGPLPEWLEPLLTARADLIGPGPLRLAEVEAGVNHRVVRVRTRGSTWYAKWSRDQPGEVASVPRNSAERLREAWALRRLEGSGLGPRRHLLVRSAHGRPAVLLQERVSGAPLDAAGLARRLPQAAGLLARAHAIRPGRVHWGGELRGPVGVWRDLVSWFGDYVELRRRHGLAPDLLLDLWGEALRAAGEALLATARRQSGRIPRALCHGDLRAQNFLATARGLQLIDWEYALSGDPAWDLAWLAVFNGLGPEQERRLALLYGARAGWPDSGLLPRFHAYARLHRLGWPLQIVCRLHEPGCSREPLFVEAEAAGALEVLAEGLRRCADLLGWPSAPTAADLRKLGRLMPGP
jgi:hypothetical protein